MMDGLGDKQIVDAPMLRQTPQIDPGFVDTIIVSQPIRTNFSSQIPPNLAQDGCWGVGLTGPCRPGQMLVVATGQRQQQALQLITTDILTPLGSPLGQVRYSRLEHAISNGGMPDGIFIVRPGEVLRFSNPVKEGLVCYSTVLGGQDASAPNAAGVPTPNIWSRVGQHTQRYSVVRFYTRDPGPIAALNYIKVPYVIEVNYDTTTAKPIDGVATPTGQACRLPYGTRNVLIHFVDAASDRRIISGSNSFDVGWVPQGYALPGVAGGQPYVAHNQADDFDAAGRGPVDATHDCEAYEVPSWASGIYVHPSATITTTTGMSAMILCTE